MLARYYLLPTIGRLSLCTVESGSSSHDYSAIYSAYSSLARATTRLMVRVCARLVLWEYQHTMSQLPYLNVCAQEKKGKGAGPIRALRYQTFPPPRHCAPNHPPIIHRQGNLNAAPRYFALPPAAGGISPLHFAKPFLHSLTLFLLCPCLYSKRRGGRDKSRIRMRI